MKCVGTLKNKKEFDFVYKNSKRYRSEFADICVLDSKYINNFYIRFKKIHKVHTVGFSISKKVGKAVERNLIKRRLRVICTMFLKDIDSVNFILIIIGKKGIKEVPFYQLKEHIAAVINRTNGMYNARCKHVRI